MPNRKGNRCVSVGCYSMKRALILWFLSMLLLFTYPAVSISAAPESDDSEYDEIMEQARKGVSDPVTGSRLFWHRGFHWESKNKNATLKLGGKFAVDTGNIDADEELDATFPDLEGYKTNIRTATVSGSGRLLKAIDYKLEIDFANAREVQDNWIRFQKIPYLGYLQMGHMKEPFSLEREGSFNHRTFMENALPTQAIPAGRNLGIMLYNLALNDRITWKLGGFYNTGSFSDVGNAQDRISDANGFDITARIAGRPWYSTDGRRLLHLGLSYSHGFRDEDLSDPDKRLRISTQPESRLTDDRLVDTGKFFSSDIDKINPEVAWVTGSFSMQGEYFLERVRTGGENLQFHGFYLYGSYLLTGENRLYSPLKSVFTGVIPKKDFKFFKGGWGAWELGARISYLDLNDGPIRGGEELNLTAGINWYLRSNVRVALNYIHANVRDREDPFIDDGTANIFQGRFLIFF